MDVWRRLTVFFPADDPPDEWTREQLAISGANITAKESPSMELLHVVRHFEGEPFKTIEICGYSAISRSLFDRVLRKQSPFPSRLRVRLTNKELLDEPGPVCIFDDSLSSAVVDTALVSKEQSEIIVKIAKYFGAHHALQGSTHIISPFSLPSDDSPFASEFLTFSNEHSPAKQEPAKNDIIAKRCVDITKLTDALSHKKTLATPDWLFESWDRRSLLHPHSFFPPPLRSHTTPDSRSSSSSSRNPPRLTHEIPAPLLHQHHQASFSSPPVLDEAVRVVALPCGSRFQNHIEDYVLQLQALGTPIVLENTVSRFTNHMIVPENLMSLVDLDHHIKYFIEQGVFQAVQRTFRQAIHLDVQSFVSEKWFEICLKEKRLIFDTPFLLDPEIINKITMTDPNDLTSFRPLPSHATSSRSDSFGYLRDQMNELQKADERLIKDDKYRFNSPPSASSTSAFSSSSAINSTTDFSHMYDDQVNSDPLPGSQSAVVVPSPAKGLMQRLTFAVYDFAETDGRKDDVHDLIIQLGGRIATDSDRVDYLVVEHGSPALDHPDTLAVRFQRMRTTPKIVSVQWFERCCQEKKILPVPPFSDRSTSIILRPLRFPVPNTVLEKMLISSASFPNFDRVNLDTLAAMLGAKLSSKLTKSCAYLILFSPDTSSSEEVVRTIKKHNITNQPDAMRIVTALPDRHLSSNARKILKDFATHKKAKFCLENNIPIVTVQWVLECAERGQKVPHHQFCLSHVPGPSSSGLPILIGSTVFFSSSVRKERDDLTKIAHSIGAEVVHVFDESVTHIIHNGKLSGLKEYSSCDKSRVKVVSSFWILRCKDSHRHEKEELFPCTFNSKLSLDHAMTTSPHHGQQSHQQAASLVSNYNGNSVPRPRPKTPSKRPGQKPMIAIEIDCNDSSSSSSSQTKSYKRKLDSAILSSFGPTSSSSSFSSSNKRRKTADGSAAFRLFEDADSEQDVKPQIGRVPLFNSHSSNSVFYEPDSIYDDTLSFQPFAYTSTSSSSSTLNPTSSSSSSSNSFSRVLLTDPFISTSSTETKPVIKDPPMVQVHTSRNGLNIVPSNDFSYNDDHGLPSYLDFEVAPLSFKSEEPTIVHPPPSSLPPQPTPMKIEEPPVPETKIMLTPPAQNLTDDNVNSSSMIDDPVSVPPTDPVAFSSTDLHPVIEKKTEPLVVVVEKRSEPVVVEKTVDPVVETISKTEIKGETPPAADDETPKDEMNEADESTKMVLSELQMLFEATSSTENQNGNILNNNGVIGSSSFHQAPNANALALARSKSRGLGRTLVSGKQTTGRTSLTRNGSSTSSIPITGNIAAMAAPKIRDLEYSSSQFSDDYSDVSHRRSLSSKRSDEKGLSSSLMMNGSSSSSSSGLLGGKTSSSSAMMDLKKYSDPSCLTEDEEGSFHSDALQAFDMDDSFSQRGPDFDVVYDVSEEEARKRELFHQMQHPSPTSSSSSSSTSVSSLSRNGSFLAPHGNQRPSPTNNNSSSTNNDVSGTQQQASHVNKIYKAFKSVSSSSSSSSHLPPVPPSSSTSTTSSAAVVPVPAPTGGLSAAAMAVKARATSPVGKAGETGGAGGGPRKVFVLSKIALDKRRDMERKIVGLGGICLSEEGSLVTMTHLISHSPTRSCKYLSAIANGSWVLTPSYILDSYREGAWKDEDSYEWKPSEKHGKKENVMMEATLYWGNEIRVRKSIPGAFSSFRVLLFTKTYHAEFVTMLECGKAVILQKELPAHPSGLPIIKNNVTHIFLESESTLNEEFKSFLRSKSDSVSILLTRFITEYLCTNGRASPAEYSAF